MVKKICIFLSLGMFILSNFLPVFATEEGLTEKAYTAYYVGSGDYATAKNGETKWKLTQEVQMSYSGMKSKHDICALKVSNRCKDINGEYYDCYEVVKNSNVIATTSSGYERYNYLVDINGQQSGDVVENDLIGETLCFGASFSGYREVSVGFSGSFPIFADLADCKAYLKDGTVGDSLVEQLPQVNKDTPVDYPHNFLVSIPTGLVGSYKENTTSTGTNIKVTWTQNKDDKFQEVYHTEFVCYKVKGKCTDSYLLPDMRTWYEFTIDNKVYWDEALSNFSTGATKESGNEYRRVIGRDTFRDFIEKNASFSDFTKVCPYYFYNNKEDVVWKLRNYIILPDGTKKYSDWSVLKGATYVLAPDGDDSDGDVISSDSDFSQNLEDSDGKSYSEKDRDAPTKNDGKHKSDSSSPSNIFEWFSVQINGLTDFLKSVKTAFKQANDTGSSFIAMFKSYNSWLPEAFLTMLVTGLGIVVFLRILGR